MSKYIKSLKAQLDESDDARNTNPDLIGPDEIDELFWYKMQMYGKWYAVFACCRVCASTILQKFVLDRETNKELELPPGIVEL